MMFERRHKKEKVQPKKEVINNEKREDSNLFRAYNEEDERIIRPITFTTIGNCRSHSLVEYPLNFSASANAYISNNTGEMLDPIIEKGIIISLSYENERIITSNLSAYIIQNSFMNICSAVNSSKYYEYFYNIPVLTYIQKELETTKFHIDAVIRNFISRDPFDTRFLDTKLVDEMMNQTIAYTRNLSMQISQYICTAICTGADKAITETMMQVHVTPNINDLYRQLAAKNPNLNSIKEQFPDDFQTHCTIYLKQIFQSIVSELMFKTINKDILYILSNTIFTLYYNYNDYLYYDFDAAREQVLQKVKKELNKQEIEDYDF